MQRVLVIDNYDSFTYNLVHLVKAIGGSEVEVRRNDKLAVSDAAAFDKILLSPGPGLPMEAGLMPEIVREYAASKPILGICLGHQCIGEIFGARLENMSDVVHGKGVEIRVTAPDEPLFAGVPQSFVGGRYHSWLVSKQGLPECLRVTAADAKGDIMALSHRSYDVRGLQFHPESVLTDVGERIMRNWLGVPA